MPLINWLLILVSVLSIFIGLYFYNPSTPVRDDIIFDNSLAHEWNKLDSEKMQVVVLGTSLLRQSFWLGARNLSDTTQLLMFYKSAGDISHFDSFVKNPMPERPQLFVIQTAILADRSGGSIPKFRERSTHSFKYYWALINGEDKRFFSKKIFARAFKCSARNDRAVDRVVGIYKESYADSVSSAVNVLKRLRDLQETGLELALLDISRSPALEARLQPELSLWRGQLSAISKGLNIPILHYPEELTDSDYCDGSHMAKSGRNLHAAWLRKEIKRLINDAS
jgi:hypothetical protein